MDNICNTCGKRIEERDSNTSYQALTIEFICDSCSKELYNKKTRDSSRAEYTLINDNWKLWKKKWKYKSLSDPEYIKEKRKFMNAKTNGWWITRLGESGPRDARYNKS